MTDRFQQRFEWMFFLVEHVKPGMVRLNNDYFAASGVLWPEQQQDGHKDTVSIVFPMENRALLLLLVNKTSAMASLAHVHKDNQTLLKVERGCLVPATMVPGGVGDRWSEPVATTGDVAAYLRQLGRMAVVLDPPTGSS